MDRETFNPTCPVPIATYPTVLLAHGGGGRLMQQLIDQVFAPAFSNPALDARHDAAVVRVGNAAIALTTDSYVVKPLFFPGGDIGSLAINGTVNDLAMAGARPVALTAGFILEEGLPIETLTRVVESMRAAAQAVSVCIVTGDTKVVDKGKGDGLFINTAGLGIIEHQLTIAPASVRPGDVVILSGDIGRHGIAIMASREGLEFESAIESDCAPLVAPVLDLIAAGVEVHCLRDLTRGGLASGLNEIAATSGCHVSIEEKAIAVREDVQAACDLLGFDPLYVANEGCFAAFVARGPAERAVDVLRRHAQTAAATIIGTVTEAPARLVTMKTRLGSSRVVDMLSGEQLPRIC
jgi:hydrogenase expression/formation protein HypE